MLKCARYPSEKIIHLSIPQPNPDEKRGKHILRQLSIVQRQVSIAYNERNSVSTYAS
jgi:hypothetical protein